ncbi:hypothetical protein AVEN_225724-1 [Araneus ventricosus]|uniref:Uncharacterized protein n=1 Tax=Araneus ventricosus TaxID=182803 RepID=A0A4Y2PCK6_ARAVE|nr:hypothetical protein AVEN_225724-1 [Araneus ventricosus]
MLTYTRSVAFCPSLGFDIGGSQVRNSILQKIYLKYGSACRQPNVLTWKFRAGMLPLVSSSSFKHGSKLRVLLQSNSLVASKWDVI